MESIILIYESEVVQQKNNNSDKNVLARSFFLQIKYKER